MNWDRVRSSQLVAERGFEPAVDPKPPDDAVLRPDSERTRARAERDRLVRAFLNLSAGQRRAQAADFKRALRPLCIDRRQVRGAWEANFAPLLPQAAPHRVKTLEPPRTTLKRASAQSGPSAARSKADVATRRELEGLRRDLQDARVFAPARGSAPRNR